ncbi:hypothetical protein BY996DRAFT_6583935 [Phakopsora pachyrhizi]|nr:hypothetical protein BY996DRAFT_6583935 [Phakopsora pachyrhizi]
MTPEEIWTTFSPGRDLKNKGKSSRMMTEISHRRIKESSSKHKADSYKNGVKSSAVGLQGQGGDRDAFECCCDFRISESRPRDDGFDCGCRN